MIASFVITGLVAFMAGFIFCYTLTKKKIVQDPQRVVIDIQVNAQQAKDDLDELIYKIEEVKNGTNNNR